MLKRSLALITAILTVAALYLFLYQSLRADPLGQRAGRTKAGAQRDPIKHIIILVKENRSFDNYFGRFPGADGARGGRISNGRWVTLGHTPDHTLTDIGHQGRAARLAVHHGRMNGFDKLPGAIQDGRDIAMSQLHESDIPNYWQYARHFTLMDHFFSTINGPSFPNHLVTVAATSNNTDDNPIMNAYHSWGCDAGKYTRVEAVNVKTGKTHFIKPCFDIQTLPDLLQEARVSWKYYAPGQYQSGYIWSSLSSIRHIRYGPLWKTNVPSTNQFLQDVKDGTLPDVSWVVMNESVSEHPPYSSCVGENWTVKELNGLMQSPLWASSAVFLTWDDFGGFYDNVPPPRLNYIAYGPRVPTLLLSPYARHHYVDHHRYDFASILRYIENKYDLPQISQYDERARSVASAFDFSQPPLPPLTLTPRDCPPGSNATTKKISGTVIRTVNRPWQHAIFVHFAESREPAKLVVLVASSILVDSSGRRVGVTDIQRGDRIEAVTVPTPDRALVYLTKQLRDRDLHFIKGQQGWVQSIGSRRPRLVVWIAGQGNETVVITGSTRFVGEGHQGLAAFHRSVPVVVSGLLDARLRLMVRATELRLKHPSRRR